MNVGVIGTGMAFERLHYPVFQKLSDKYKIVALCDVDLQKREQWAGRLGLSSEDTYEDYNKMLERDDIDVYDIIVPLHLNYQISEAVAKKIGGTGRGIICEKPTADNMENALAHYELSGKYEVPVMIAEHTRYSDEINMIRDAVLGQKTGEVYYFIYNTVLNFPGEMVGDNYSAREWRQYPDYPGGFFLDSGVHNLAVMRHIFGTVDKVHAFARPEELSFSPYSAINANILFHSGVTGQFSFFCSGNEAQRPRIGLRIFGTEGIIYLEDQDCGTVNFFYNNGDYEKIDYTPQNGFYNEMLNIYNALKHNEPVYVTPEVCYGDTKMAFDIIKSIEGETVVQVEIRSQRSEIRGREKIQGCRT